ncbi:hypothetical protein Cgig2_033953 [Carnegiea gigantea]|uniref:GRAM domain-containing protein n=1 Tax=Carnegiea gigantea TaxID=171969 RepID=A0A9Q1KCZ0_9CARY|nr:hypothetical protein Cgig2_033953 [Carnegiea gigantea]
MDVSKAFKSRSMKTMLGDHLLRNALPRVTHDIQTRTTRPMKLLPGPSDASCSWRQYKVGSIFSVINKFVTGKLSLGAKVLQVGRVDKLFRQIFSVREGEQLLHGFKCNLSTTAGPITGRLFISTDKIAFCSDTAIAKFSSPTGEIHRFHYKVVIPLSKIKKSNQSENMKRSSQKYLQVVTKDDFEFWFMGFLNHKKTFNCLKQALYKA